MDHYSLEMMAKLHYRELMDEGLREQAVQRQSSRKHLSDRIKQSLWLISSLILVLFYWLTV